MFFRKADIKDCSFIAGALKDILALHANGRGDIFRSSGAKYDQKSVEKQLGESDKHVFVAEENGVLYGYAICNTVIRENDAVLKDKKIFYLDDLYVIRDCRGKGTGKVFMDFLFKYAKENDFDTFELNVWEFDGSATAFYEKCGMTTQRRIMEKKLK